MKMNAFERIIRILACSGVVFSASSAIGQINDGSVTYGALQLVDENGSDVAAPSSVEQNLGAPIAQPMNVQGPSEVLPPQYVIPQQYVVPQQQYEVPQQFGVPTYPLPEISQGEVPLVETEVPGSAYFVGPNGERIEPSQMMNGPVEITPGGEVEVPGTAPTYSVEPFSVERVYDGTQIFPMGTFPTTPFGERIISEVPSGETASNTVGQKAPVAGNADAARAGNADAVRLGEKTPGYEFLKPSDSIAGVLSDSSAKSEKSSEASGNATLKQDDGSLSAVEREKSEPSTEKAMQKAPMAKKEELKRSKSKPNSVEVTNKSKKAGNESVDKPAKSASADNQAAKTKNGRNQKPNKIAKGSDDHRDQVGRQARLKQRLRDALTNKDRLDTLLRNANKKNQTAMAEIDKLKSSLAKVKDSLQEKTAQSRKTTAEAAKNVKALQLKQSKMSKQLEALANTLQKQRQSAKAAIAKANANEAKIKSQNEELAKEIEMLAAAKTKAMEQVEEAQQQIANLNNDLSKQREATKAAVASAEAYNDKVKMLTEKMAAQSKATQSALGAGIVAAGANSVTGAENGADADSKSPSQPSAKEIAELEVKRKLEERRKKQLEKQASQSMEKSKDKDASHDATKQEDNLTLDQRIAILKKKRDSQIAALETRIRAKHQKKIDELIESGKTVDSDEVKDAVGSMRTSIKTSEEKLRSRFSRKLDRLKKEFKTEEK